MCFSTRKMGHYSGDVAAVDALARVEVGQRGGDMKSEEIKVSNTNNDIHATHGDTTAYAMRRLAAQAPVLRAEQARPLNPNGGDRKSEQNQNDNCKTDTDYGNSADYLTARIARDRPDILEDMKAGIVDGEVLGINKRARYNACTKAKATWPRKPVVALACIAMKLCRYFTLGPRACQVADRIIPCTKGAHLSPGSVGVLLWGQ